MIEIEIYHMHYNCRNGMYYVDKSFPQKNKKRKNSTNTKKINTPVNSITKTTNKNHNSEINTPTNNLGSKFGKTEIISSKMIVVDGGMRF
ncbi:hypothetical protein C1N86_27825 (plasmid) [Priestia aryabhattai]